MNLGWFEIGLNIEDIERSLEFYQTLGFERVNGSVEIRTATLCKGDCRIALYQGYGEEPLYLQFYQGDVEAISRDLESKGLQSEGIRRDHRGVAARFRDPDGNLLHFIKQPERFRPDHRTDEDKTSGPDLGWFTRSRSPSPSMSPAVTASTSAVSKRLRRRKLAPKSTFSHQATLPSCVEL